MVSVGLLRVCAIPSVLPRGNCSSLCGAFLWVTVPTEHSAMQALSDLFDQHVIRDSSSKTRKRCTGYATE
jgi:hypothetical protein